MLPSTSVCLRNRIPPWPIPICVQRRPHSTATALAQVAFKAGVNKRPKKIKTVWHGVRGILKLSGRVNQASLKLSVFQILSVGLQKLFLRCKLLDLTESERDTKR